MKSKHLKLIMELIFIFIIPLGILLINCNYQNTIEYDNNGNYQSTEKHIEFTPPFDYSLGYKNVINNFNLWNENYQLGYWANGYFQPSNDGFLSSVDPISVLPNSNYYYYNGKYETDPSVFYIACFDSSMNFIQRYTYTYGTDSIFTTPNNCFYIQHSTQSNYGITYLNDICINISVSWANGNYVPYGEPLILYTQTDVSGQNNYVYTIWGQLKNLIVDNLQLQDNVIIDIIISYTILWFTMFVIWHFFYWVFDGIVHLFIDWVDKGKKSD